MAVNIGSWSNREQRELFAKDEVSNYYLNLRLSNFIWHCVVILQNDSTR